MKPAADLPHTTGERHAVYFAPPPHSEWWRFGCAWLGRDPLSGLPVEHPRVPGVAAATIAEITADARRYGFHATLKPPFALGSGFDKADLYQEVESLARSQTPFSLGALEVRTLGRFIVLRPAQAPPQLQSLARDCVEHLDPLRAAPSGAELARRRGATLTPRQDAFLERWGYPFVLDEWRFHMTLTRSLSTAEATSLMDWLKRRVDCLNAEPLSVDALCVFEQSVPDAPFRLVRRMGFDGSVTDHAAGGR